MQPDNVKRIITEDYDNKDRELITKLAEVYNPFAEQIVNILSGNIQIDNMDRQFIEFKVKVSSTGNPIQSTKFAAKVGYSGSSVIRAINLTNPSKFVNSCPFVTYNTTGNGIYVVKNITGLDAGDEYTLKLELLP